MVKRKGKVTRVCIIAVAIPVMIWASWPVPKTPAPLIHKQTTHQWTRTDSLSFAQDQLLANADKQFACLKNLWGKESGWNPHAKNLVRSQGLHAGGIPQLLGMSPLTPPSAQIRRGLRYIEYRYATPCIAWQHWQQKGWY